MKIIAVIPARLNSTRLPNKLLKDICGKTLIRRTYEATKNSSLFDDVLVVTNSEEILKELKNNQIKFYTNGFIVTKSMIYNLISR